MTATNYVQQAVSAVLLAPDGSNFTVRVPVGHGSTMAMILACGKAQRPLIISRASQFVVNELHLLQTGRGRPVPEPFTVPKYVRIMHPQSCTFERLDGYSPDLIIVANPSARPNKYTKAIMVYLLSRPTASLVAFES